jgi:hypothetical protein
MDEMSPLLPVTSGLSQLALLLAHFLSVDRTTPNFGDANLDLINTLKVGLASFCRHID